MAARSLGSVHWKHNPDFSPERPPVSFAINATTWRELGAAAHLFDNVGVTFDIFPCNIFIAMKRQ